MESVEVTRVVTETTESFAFDVEEEAMAEEEAADIATLDEETDTFEAEAEEAAAEMVEEEATPTPEATAVPGTTNPLQGDAAEDGATAAEPIVQPTATVSPTPTVSTLPRVTPPTSLPDRDMEQAAGSEAANDAVAEVPQTDDDTTSAETTAVLPEEDVQALETETLRPFDPLLMLQVGLGALLLLLAGLTFYARRQR
jgi:hypothetical protein